MKIQSYKWSYKFCFFSSKEIMSWFCAIRMAKIKLLQETFPERPLDIVRSCAS